MAGRNKFLVSVTWHDGGEAVYEGYRVTIQGDELVIQRQPGTARPEIRISLDQARSYVIESQ